MRGVAAAKKIGFLFISVLCSLSSGGCSTDSDEIDNPEPISPAPRPGNSIGTGSNGSSATFVASPAKAIPVPTKNCTVEITRGETNSSGKEGAAIALSEVDGSQSGDLLFRIQSTESFVEVKEQLFSVAPFPAGAWIFEFYSETGHSCLVPLNVTNDDVVNKIRLMLKLTLPN